ncbi:MAG: RNA polymerase sigma factor [Phycisphaerales bacterium]
MGGARTDAELVTAIAAGNDEAFAALVDRHGAWGMSVARRFSGNEAAAEDALQESLLHLIERSGRLVIDESVRPWLYAVIRNRTLAQRRDASRTKAAEAIDLPADPPGQDLDDEIRRAVASLSEPLRETLILRIVDGLSVAETALALGVPEGTVKSRLSAALAALREHPALRAIF